MKRFFTAFIAVVLSLVMGIMLFGCEPNSGNKGGSGNLGGSGNQGGSGNKGGSGNLGGSGNQGGSGDQGGSGNQGGTTTEADINKLFEKLSAETGVTLTLKDVNINTVLGGGSSSNNENSQGGTGSQSDSENQSSGSQSGNTAAGESTKVDRADITVTGNVKVKTTKSGTGAEQVDVPNVDAELDMSMIPEDSETGAKNALERAYVRGDKVYTSSSDEVKDADDLVYELTDLSETQSVSVDMNKIATYLIKAMTELKTNSADYAKKLNSFGTQFVKKNDVKVKTIDVIELLDGVIDIIIGNGNASGLIDKIEADTTVSELYELIMLKSIVESYLKDVTMDKAYTAIQNSGLLNFLPVPEGDVDAVYKALTGNNNAPSIKEKKVPEFIDELLKTKQGEGEDAKTYGEITLAEIVNMIMEKMGGEPSATADKGTTGPTNPGGSDDATALMIEGFKTMAKSVIGAAKTALDTCKLQIVLTTDKEGYLAQIDVELEVSNDFVEFVTGGFADSLTPSGGTNELQGAAADTTEEKPYITANGTIEISYDSVTLKDVTTLKTPDKAANEFVGTAGVNFETESVTYEDPSTGEDKTVKVGEKLPGSDTSEGTTLTKNYITLELKYNSATEKYTAKAVSGSVTTNFDLTVKVSNGQLCFVAQNVNASEPDNDQPISAGFSLTIVGDKAVLEFEFPTELLGDFSVTLTKVTAAA